MWRYPFRFSILSLQVVILFVALWLGIRLSIEPRLHWFDLWVILFAISFQAVVFWLVLSAPWSAWLAAMGFVLGTVVEFAALNHAIAHDLIRLTPGKWTPEGWYPLTLPAERLLITLGWAAVPNAFLPAIFMGMALSGLAGCSMMLGSWSLWRMSRWRKVAVSLNTPDRDA